MTANPRTTDRDRFSERSRLDLVEEIVREAATVELGSTAIAVDATGTPDWETDAAAEMELETLTKSYSGIDWIALVDQGGKDTLQLRPGRYRVTLNLAIRNQDASDPADIHVAFKTEDDTIVWTNGDNAIKCSAAAQDETATLRRAIYLDVTEATVYWVCLKTSNAGANVTRQPGFCQIEVERMG